MGAYGYDAATTPAFDALAERGQIYTRAYSPYPLTIPAHASIHTGLYPPQHGVRDNGDRTLEPSFTTLAERLRDAGYATGAAVAAFVTARQWGFAQGFDGYRDDIPRAADFWHASRRGEEVVEDALAWYAAQDPEQPVFLWVHLYDAHLPLEPPEPFASAHPNRPYDGEIAYVDAQLGRLVSAFPEDTLFVVTADHGESNGEHGERDHGLYIYDATQRVPLLFAGPGVAPGVHETPVSLVDIVPTVLSLLEMPRDPDLPGVALPSDEERALYMESWQLANRFGIAPHVGVVRGTHKLIATPRPELYAWPDSAELADLAQTQPAEVASLELALDELGFEPPSGANAALDPAALAELAALGYVVGSAPDRPIQDLPDPKDRRDLLEGLHLTSLRTAASPEEAIARLKVLVARYPEVPETRIRLAQFYLRGGDAVAAERTISDGLALDEGPGLRMALVGPLLEQGRMADALELLLGLRDSYDFSPRFRMQLLTTLVAAGRGPEMVDVAEGYMRSYPQDREVPGVLGVYLARHDEEHRAWPLLERARAGERPPPDVCFALAMRSIAAGDRERGLALLDEELTHHPLNLRARRLIAAMARDDANWLAWEEHTRWLTRQAPEDPMAWHDHAQALFNLRRYEPARKALDEGLQRGPAVPALVLLDANLLAKEGQRERGRERFEEAKRLQEAAPP
jgi:choline-sulfatase